MVFPGFHTERQARGGDAAFKSMKPMADAINRPWLHEYFMTFLWGIELFPSRYHR